MQIQTEERKSKARQVSRKEGEEMLDIEMSESQWEAASFEAFSESRESVHILDKQLANGEKTVMLKWSGGYR